MRPVITVAIFDENAYFASGLLAAISDYFGRTGIAVRRVTAQYPGVDMIFQYFPSGIPTCFCLYEGLKPGFSPLCFAIRQPHDRPNGRANCALLAGVIQHDFSLASALQIITCALARRQEQRVDQPVSMGLCTCTHNALTLREKQVMIYLRQELSLAEIGSRLTISIKTVSNHKMSVMRKMGFRRNMELYRWLRQGL